jgi:hypothetical protein
MDRTKYSPIMVFRQAGAAPCLLNQSLTGRLRERAQNVE